MKVKLFATLIALGVPALATAANISLVAEDALNTTSFNTGLNWSGGNPPSSGNDYFTENFRLRTPPDGGSYTFGGDSLTINNTNGYSWGLMYKGTGAAGTITINNLILDGGMISHANGIGDVLNLAGNINVVSPSTIYAKQGNINIPASISGTGDLIISQTDAPTQDNRYVNLLGNNSVFTGKLTVNGRIRIISEESLGGNPAAFAADQLTLDGGGNGGWLAVSNTFAINDPNRGITIGGAGAQIVVSNPDTNTVANLTITSPITGFGPLTKRGGGVLTLSGNNDFSGGLTLFSATAGSQLNINNSTALGFGSLTLNADANPAILDNTSGSSLTLANNNSQNWNNSFTFLGSSSLSMGAGTVILGANVTATVSNNNLSVGAMFDDGLARVLTKQGPGTLTIDGGGFYFGNTVVNEGVLALTTVGSLSSPVVTVAMNATLNVSGPGFTMAFAQTLSGSGTVVGNVSDGGATSTVIDPGTSPGTLTFNGNLDLLGGTALNYELSSTTTVGGGVNDLIVVSGQLNLAGPTTINITGAPTTGTYTLIQYGSLAGSAANLLVPPGYALNDTGSAIELVVTHVPVDLTWVGDGALNIWDLGTTANWSESGSPSVFLTGDAVTFNNSGSSTPPVTLSGDQSPGSVTVNASQNYTFTGGGIISGSLTKSGSGTLILDNTNSYSGPTVINGGTLQLGDQFSTTTFGMAGTIGSGPVTNNGIFAMNRIDDFTVTSDIHGSGTISNFSSSGTVSLSGNITGGTIIMNGSGSLALSGSNSYAGLTIASTGAILTRNGAALGAASSGTVVSNGAQVFIDQNINIEGEPLTLNGAGPLGDGALRKGGGGVTSLGGPITLGTDTMIKLDGGATLNLTNASGITGAGTGLTLTGDGGSQGTITGPLALGSGSLTKSGGGNWTIAANNNYTGKTFVNGGTLFIPEVSSLGPISVATPDFITFGGGILGATTNLSFSGGMRGFTLAGNGGFNAPANATLTVANEITGAGELTKNGEGTLVLSGNNSFSGVLNLDRGGDGNLSDGTTRITSASAVANVTLIRSHRTSVGAAGGATLQLAPTSGAMTLTTPLSLTCRNNTTTPTVQNASGTNLLSGDVAIFTGGNQVIFDAAAGSQLTMSGPIQYQGTLLANRNLRFRGEGSIVVSGSILLSSNGVTPVSLIKEGSGVLTLGGANTYSGTTSIDGGLCMLNGSITSTGLVTVAGGALSGNGTINGNVEVSSSVPSGTIDSLTISSSLNINGPLAVDVNRAGFVSDRPTVSGTVSNGGAGSIVVNNLGAPLEVGDTFTLFNGPVTGGATMGVSGASAVWNNNLAVDGTISVASTVVPQPQIDSTTLANGSLILNGSGGPAGSPFDVLSSTNVAQPLIDWTVVNSGTFDSSGNFNVTNAIVPNELTRFFLIAIP